MDGSVFIYYMFLLHFLNVPEPVIVNTLESGPLGIQGEACLEFWYLAPIAAEGSELRVLLKSSAGRLEIWSSPALARDAWRRVLIPLYLTEQGAQVKCHKVKILYI